VPAQLGGWSCAGNACTLRTTGDASPAKAVQACRSLRQMALQSGSKLRIDLFEVNQKVRLTEAQLRACMN
jgi:hypothetical protein